MPFTNFGPAAFQDVRSRASRSDSIALVLRATPLAFGPFLVLPAIGHDGTLQRARLPVQLLCALPRDAREVGIFQNGATQASDLSLLRSGTGAEA